MERIKKSIEVDCPLSHVYNQWTQFEEFPRFMDGVKAVRQLDDQRLHWRAEVAGVDNGPPPSPNKFPMIASPRRLSPASILLGW